VKKDQALKTKNQGLEIRIYGKIVFWSLQLAP